MLNDVAIDSRGDVYVSDSLGGAIWRLTPDGELELWSDSELWKAGVHPIFGVPFGVNGLAYHEGALYGTIYLNGRVVGIPIQRDGTAGVAEVIVEDAALVGADGIELDVEGNIYVAVNDSDTLVRIRARDLGRVRVGITARPSAHSGSEHRAGWRERSSASSPAPPGIGYDALSCRSAG